MQTENSMKTNRMLGQSHGAEAMNAGWVGTDAREPDVRRAMNDLQYHIQLLVEHTHELIGRISPVSRDPAPRAEAAGSATKDYSCDIARSIQNNTSAVMHLLDTVLDATQRLEI